MGTNGTSRSLIDYANVLVRRYSTLTHFYPAIRDPLTNPYWIMLAKVVQSQEFEVICDELGGIQN